MEVKLLSTTANGCRDSAEVNIAIEEKPVARFSVSNICAGQNINIVNESFTNTGFIDRVRWKIDGDKYVDNEPVVSFSNAGIKDFLLAVYSGTGCKDSIQKSIEILDSVSLKIVKPDKICSEQIVQFSSSSDGKISAYNWNFGNGTSSSSTLGETIYDAPGQFRVELRATTEACGDKIRFTNVDVGTTPKFNLAGSLDICEGSSTDVFVDVFNVSNPIIVWSNGDMGNTTTVFSSDFDLNVSVESAGCIKKQNIAIVNECDVYIPNAFAPSGLNSTFMILDKSVESFELFIYNRWGETLFMTNSFNKPWDGNYKGNPAPVDTYAYMVRGVKEDGETFKRTGAFTLIR